MLGTINVRMAARERQAAHDAAAGSDPESDCRTMTTRIDSRFAELEREGRAALVTFVMAGDPDPETSLAILKALPEAGADVIELGMPFTDPMADGPAIQAAGLRALARRADAGQDARAGARVPQGRRRHADRADGLLQSDLYLRRRRASSPTRRRPASTA